MNAAAPDAALVAAVAAAGALLVGRPPRVRGVADRLGGPRRTPGAGGSGLGAHPSAADPGSESTSESQSVVRAAARVVGAFVAVAFATTLLTWLTGDQGTGLAVPGVVRATADLARTTGLPGIAPAAAAAAAVAVRARHRSRGLSEVAKRRRSVTDGVQLLAAELRVGTPALSALAEAARLAPVLLPAARAGALGGSVPAALGVAARSSGAAGLAYVAAAWEVSAEMGAGLADTMDSLVAILRAEDLARDQTVAALAAPRATARLLCVLPLGGLVLGSGIGAHPWHTLTHTSWGPLLALAAVVLAGGGLEWVERLSAAAADPGREVR